MDISRDVVEGKPVHAQFRHLCVCKGLKSRLFWADIHLRVMISLYLSRVCRVSQTGYDELVVSAHIIHFCQH